MLKSTDRCSRVVRVIEAARSQVQAIQILNASAEALGPSRPAGASSLARTSDGVGWFGSRCLRCLSLQGSLAIARA